MKDIVITSQRIRKERNFYLLSFVLSFATNIIAIIIYSRPWIEIGSQIGYVVVISFLVYLILLVIRLTASLFFRFFKRKIRTFLFTPKDKQHKKKLHSPND